MASITEISTVAIAMVTVVGVSITATVYFAEGSNTKTPPSNLAENNGSHRYVISDAYYMCRDHIGSAITQGVRNINVDSHSSRYDEARNDNVVYIDIQLLDQADDPASEAEDAKIECRVSAESNEIRAFQVRKN